jgi:hypothetical protein
MRIMIVSMVQERPISTCELDSVGDIQSRPINLVQNRPMHYRVEAVRARRSSVRAKEGVNPTPIID